MNLPSSPHPLTDPEKERLVTEYKTLALHAKRVMNTEKIDHQEQLHYRLGTSSDIDFSLRFLALPTNECIVESIFSMVDDTDEELRPLSKKNLEDICAIRKNGPHPLA